MTRDAREHYLAVHRRNFGVTRTKSVHFAPIYSLNRQVSRKITRKPI